MEQQRIALTQGRMAGISFLALLGLLIASPLPSMPGLWQTAPGLRRKGRNRRYQGGL